MVISPLQHPTGRRYSTGIDEAREYLPAYSLVTTQLRGAEWELEFVTCSGNGSRHYGNCQVVG